MIKSEKKEQEKILSENNDKTQENDQNEKKVSDELREIPNFQNFFGTVEKIVPLNINKLDPKLKAACTIMKKYNSIRQHCQKYVSAIAIDLNESGRVLLSGSVAE